MIYLIGSMRNPNVPIIASELRQRGFEVFDDWHASGPECDDHWKKYEQDRGRTYLEALHGAHAKNVFDFDLRHLKAADTAVLVCPAGKSGHMELGWMLGQGKKGYILLDAEDVRWDIMYKYATDVFVHKEDLYATLSANDCPF